MVKVYSDGFHVAWLLVYVAFATGIVTLNVVTIITILVNRQLRTRHSLIGVTNLAFADTFVGLLAIPCYITEYGNWFLKWKLSFVQNNSSVFRGTEVFSSIASLSFLVLICLERCYATFFPFKSRMTLFVTYVVCMVSTWLIAILSVVLFLLFKPFFFLMAWLLASTCVISIGYLAILIKMKTQNRQHQAMRRRRASNREKELAKTLFIVTVSSIVCWVPFLVFSLLVYHEVYYSVIASHFGKLLQFTNSLINPVIYLLRMRDVRNAALRLVKKCSRDDPRSLETRSTDGVTISGMANVSTISPCPFSKRGQTFQKRNGPFLVVPSSSPGVELRKILQKDTGSNLSLIPSQINKRREAIVE